MDITTNRPRATPEQLAAMTAYAQQSPKHAEYTATMLTGRAASSLDYLASVTETLATDFLRGVQPVRRRATESAEVNGYMVDRGEDN